MTDAVDLPPSLTLGCKRLVTISDIAFGGEGVARVDDFVMFVPFVLVGEEGIFLSCFYIFNYSSIY